MNDDWQDKAIADAVDAWLDFTEEFWVKPILRLEWALGWLFYPVVEWLYFRLGGR